MSKSGKHIAFHVASGDFGLLLAKGDFTGTPARVDDIKVFSVSEEGLADKVRAFLGVRGKALEKVSCSFSPSSRFFKKVAIESAAKLKSPTFFSELMQAQKIVADDNEVAVLLPNGAHYEADGAAPKELMFVGVPTKEVVAFQERLVEWGAYPVSIELATLPMLAAISVVSAAEGRKSPTLVVELGEEVSFLHIMNGKQVDFTRQIPFGFKSMLPQIKTDLGLADEAVAKKILWANTFDFTEMAPTLLRRLVKEIQASVGFYEVQTGFATGQIIVPDLPSRFAWIPTYLARALSLDPMPVDFDHWPARIGVELAPALVDAGLDNVCWNLFAQVGTYE